MTVEGFTIEPGANLAGVDSIPLALAGIGYALLAIRAQLEGA